MNFIITKIRNNLIRLAITGFILLIIIAFPSLTFNFNKGIDVLFHYSKGEGIPDTNIVLLTITQEDIRNLGGWPLKRSYYALLISSLKEFKPRIIGLEIFLSEQYTPQIIYDELLLSEIKKTERIVLSSLSGPVEVKGDKFFSTSLEFPSLYNKDSSIITGHINYLESVNQRIPLLLNHNGNEENAFSYLLIGKEKKQFNKNYISVNYIASSKKFRQLSLIDFFDLYADEKESLNFLADKIIIIGVTDNQTAQQVYSPFDGKIAGIYLHAFAADNMLNQRFLSDSNSTSIPVMFLILLIFFLFFPGKNKEKEKLYYDALFIAVLIISLYSLFAYAYYEINYAFFILPLITLFIADIYSFINLKYRQMKDAADETVILKKLLESKEEVLKNLENKLSKSEKENSANLEAQIVLLKNDIQRLSEKNEDKEAAEAPVLKGTYNFEGLIFASVQLKKISEMIEKVAPENASVLITGESGTGKELVARAIHNLSKRNDKNFIAVNCGALPESLLESELFGHIKGAFTGAIADKPGRFEAADKGTIFLDEIGETSEKFQVKLLRVLQSGEYEKVGSAKSSFTDVRVLAATNKPVEVLVHEKKMREDLYYRLNVIRIEIPPLRERKEDIIPLTHHFLSVEEKGMTISKAVAEVLMKNDWKGNVRELESIIKRGVIFAKADKRAIIQLADLPAALVKEVKFNIEELILDSLRNKGFSHSSINETANELGGISRVVVSENLRGMAFRMFVEHKYDINKAAEAIAASSEVEVVNKVKNKIVTFILNIEESIKGVKQDNFEMVKEHMKVKYKNLPKRFHYYLDEVIHYYLD